MLSSHRGGATNNKRSVSEVLDCSPDDREVTAFLIKRDEMGDIRRLTLFYKSIIQLC